MSLFDAIRETRIIEMNCKEDDEDKEYNWSGYFTCPITGHKVCLDMCVGRKNNKKDFMKKTYPKCVTCFSCYRKAAQLKKK